MNACAVETKLIVHRAEQPLRFERVEGRMGFEPVNMERASKFKNLGEIISVLAEAEAPLNDDWSIQEVKQAEGTNL